MEATRVGELLIAVEETHPVTRRAARQLESAWKAVFGEGRGARAARDGHDDPVVRLSLGSLVRPSVVVRFAAPFREEPASDAERLALTTAAWDSFDWREPWLDLSAPLSSAPRWGRPDDEVPWTVMLGSHEAAPPVEASVGQLHVIGGRPLRPKGAVWWPRWPRVAAAVLGRASVVVGEADALVFDAIRAGIPVRTASGRLVEPLTDELPSFGGVLAGLVPPSLLEDRALWNHVAAAAAALASGGEPPAPLMTPGWIAAGRAHISRRRPASPLELLQRRFRKLRRDPRSFFADSRHASVQRLGKIAAELDRLRRRQPRR